MKILNLYAGIGGNRKLWPKEHEVIAIENNLKIAKIYKDFFPNDKVIVGDAHKFLLEHFKEFDFIWSSPPCPTHSRMVRFFLNSTSIWNINRKLKYPDMRLYQEILILKYWFKGKWCVENVISYYDPLIKPKEVHRHYFWSNFFISNIDFPRCSDIARADNEVLEKFHGFDLSKFNLTKEERGLLTRNCVYPSLGLHIFNCAFKNVQQNLRNAI